MAEGREPLRARLLRDTPLAQVQALVTFEPFSHLPSAVREAYLAGSLATLRLLKRVRPQGLFSAAMVVMLSVFSASPTLHAWLHSHDAKAAPQHATTAGHNQQLVSLQLRLSHGIHLA